MVLDTSALLALIRHEPGASRVAEVINSSIVSTVNLSEFTSKLVDRGFTDEQARSFADSLPVRKVPFDAAQAIIAGLLRRTTRGAGLSLGDRACLALAQVQGFPTITSDRAWAALDLGIQIEVIR